MNKLEDVSFDEVMRKLETAEWKMLIETVEQKDGPTTKFARYYAQVGELYVHIGRNSEKGIFGYRLVHELRITTKPFNSYGETLATFTGSRSFFGGEKRKIERVLKNIYRNLEEWYERYEKEQQLKRMEEERRKGEEIRGKLRRTFK